MMNSIFIPLMIGAMGVLQNTFNKKIGESLGVPLTLLINNIVLLGCGVSFFCIAKMIPKTSLPDLFQQKIPFEVSWKYFVPGVFGYLIILTAPYAIQKVGATRVFIGVIVAQIVVSMLWDFFAESIPFSSTKIVGAGLALAGALLASK